MTEKITSCHKKVGCVTRILCCKWFGFLCCAQCIYFCLFFYYFCFLFFCMFPIICLYFPSISAEDLGAPRCAWGREATHQEHTHCLTYRQIRLSYTTWVFFEVSRLLMGCEWHVWVTQERIMLVLELDGEWMVRDWCVNSGCVKLLFRASSSLNKYYCSAVALNASSSVYFVNLDIILSISNQGKSCSQGYQGCEILQAPF